MPTQCLHGKLDFIMQAIKAGDKGISLDQGPPRTVSFLNYLGDAKEDRLAGVIAQDFYSICLLGVNAILKYAGTDLLNDTREMDFGSLMNHIANLRSREELTPEQEIFLRYVDDCIS